MPQESNPFFQVEDLDGASVVTLHTEALNLENRDLLYAFADGLKDSAKPYHVVADLAPNPSINSQMIGVLIHFQKRVKDAGATLRYCGILPQVRKLLDITRTSSLFQIEPNRKEALADLGINPASS